MKINKDLIILITVGTGRYARNFLKYTLDKFLDINRIIVFSRDELKQWELHEKGIKVQLHYLPIHSHPYFGKLVFKENQFPNSEENSRRAIILPLYPEQEKENKKLINIGADQFINLFLEFYNYLHLT